MKKLVVISGGPRENPSIAASMSAVGSMVPPQATSNIRAGISREVCFSFMTVRYIVPDGGGGKT